MAVIIPRLHLFELEDQSWFPTVVRDLATDYLRFVEKQCSLHHPITAILARALKRTQTRRLIDLCSGGAGPVLPLRRDLAAAGFEVSVVLTDLFPNVPAFEEAEASSGGTVSFVREPVDARAVPPGLTGFRTLFNAFHHFRPTDAVAVLRDAARAGQPVGVFEIPERTVRMLVLVAVLTPLLVVVATPFIRPFRWQRLLWTYLVPTVPLTCWWDGIVSQFRAYTPAELEGLAADVGVAGYTWEAGKVPIGPVPGRLTYLVGTPTEC